MPKLTNRQVRDATAKNSFQDFSDAGTPLTLRVKLNGEKSWIWRGRIDGKQTKRTIGTYPEMTLFDARMESMRLRRDAKLSPANLAAVVHPHHRTTGKTVVETLELYQKAEANFLRSGKDIASNMRRFVIPLIGTKQLKNVVKQDIRNVLMKAQETMKGAGVNRLLAHVKRWLNYCVENDFIESNPALSIVKPAKEVINDHIIPPSELGFIKKALPAAGKYADPFGMLLYTMCRRSDILELKWSEVETDRLAIKRTKNGKPFMVYLTESAKSFLPARPKEAKSDDRVFAAVHPQGSGKSLKLLRAKALELAANDGRKMAHFILHDFRGSGVTYLASLLDNEERQIYPPAVRDALLNHAENGVRAKHYDMHVYWREKKSAVIAWNAMLDHS